MFCARTLRRWRPPQQLRLLGDVGSDASGLVFGQEVRRRAAAGLVLVLDVRERLSALRLHDEASVVILDGPGRREAAG